MKSLFDFNDPFYRPLWLRVLIVAATTGWGVFEFISGEAFWGTLFCAIGAYAFYGMFVVFDPGDPEAGKDESKRNDG